MKSSTCVSCTEERSAGCPKETKIQVDSTIQELNQDILIKFSPSFENQLSTSDLSTITADSLTKNHLELTYKDIAGKEEQLTIVDSGLTHTKTASEGSSILRLTFLQKLRFGKVESIRVKVTDPWIYRAGSSNQNQAVVYVQKDWEQQSMLTEKVRSDEEKGIETAQRYGSAVSVGVNLVGMLTILVRAFMGGASSSIVLMIKFFNIIDKVSNLQKINVGFGSRIKIAFNFIKSISLPDLPFIGSLSPIHDAEPDDADRSAYQLVPRGSRAKITDENEQILLASGQNFVFSLLIVIFWTLMTLLEFCFDNRSKVLGVVSLIYQTMIGLLFFDFQMITLAEIAFFNYSKIRSFQWKFVFSLMLSGCILVLIVIEFLKASFLINRKRLKGNSKAAGEDSKGKRDALKAEDGEMETQLTPDNLMIIQKYTEFLNLDQKKGGIILVLVSDIRFFMIQVVIVSLQHLNRSQSVIVVIINGGYLIYFVCVLFREKVFKTKVLLIKEIAQEVSVMVLISTITVFSFTEKTEFKNSNFYSALEVLAIFSIIGVCGAEFFILISGMLSAIISSCKKKSVKKRREIFSKEDVFEIGGREGSDLAKNNPRKRSGKTKNPLTIFEKASIRPKQSSGLKNMKNWFDSEKSLTNSKENKLSNQMESFFGGEEGRQNDGGGGAGTSSHKIDIRVQYKKKMRVNRAQKGFSRAQKDLSTQKSDQWNFKG